jgi:hypothetical protein
MNWEQTMAELEALQAPHSISGRETITYVWSKYKVVLRSSGRKWTRSGLVGTRNERRMLQYHHELEVAGLGERLMIVISMQAWCCMGLVELQLI